MMTQYRLIMALSWFSYARPQYINSGGPGAESIMNPLNIGMHVLLPYENYFNSLLIQNDTENYQADESSGDVLQFYRREDGVQQPDFHRRRRTVANEPKDKVKRSRWPPNLIDTDKTTNVWNDDKTLTGPFIIQELARTLEKKSFSPWGGKRDKAALENMWTWRRPDTAKEPSMPKSTKRVRFSPWGGKRSAPLIHKPGGKGSKLIFCSTAPEITRFLANFSPSRKRFNTEGFQIISGVDKKHSVGLLALSTNTESKKKRDALPFHEFLETLPKLFRPGHSYAKVNLKKDGKRKVKFSAWGGKRAPPIIGPIWKPTSQNEKDSTLDAILLVRENADKIITSKAL